MNRRRGDVLSAIEAVRLTSDRHLAIAGLALLLIPAIWFIRSDVMLYGGNWPMLRERLWARAALVGILAIGMLVLATRVRTRGAYARTATWLAWLMVAAVFTITALRPAGSGMPLRTPFLNIAFLFFALPSTPLAQLAPPYALSAGLIGLRSTRLSGGDLDVIGDIVALVCLNLIGTVAVWRRTRQEESTSQVVVELRQLRDIIPICSHCRKIQSDIGDWQQLEQYFLQHGDTLFSHGTCPDCAAHVRRRAGP